MTTNSVEPATEETPSLPITATVTEIATMGLSAQQRCDRCGAQAYVEVDMGKRNDLLFCSHHYRKHESVIKDKAIRVFDYTPFLEAQERMLPSH